MSVCHLCTTTQNGYLDKVAISVLKLSVGDESRYCQFLVVRNSLISIQVVLSLVLNFIHFGKSATISTSRSYCSG